MQTTKTRYLNAFRLAFSIAIISVFVSTGAAQSVTRGPYLQIGTPNSTIVRWRTNIATDSRVTYGTTQGSLTLSAGNGTLTTEHEILLSSLAPATKYFYSVGSTTQVLAGNDSTHFFVTSPVPGTASPTRIWILGDSGTADTNAQAVRNAYLTFTGNTHTNLWLMLGDNAYESGLDSEYQTAVFNMYPTTLRQSVLWPTIGNHDTAQSSNPPASLPYFAMFTLPANAEAGGMASGTEKYYSFDYGNIHFICLDSMTSDRSATGPMANWLRADLASSTRQWTIAFWHHPPYSKGSHNSDTETNLVEMRQVFLPILEEAGVDLVLAGHSHSYERSYLIDGHYGVSTTFTSAMKKDGGSGRTDGTGAYTKPTLGLGPHEGAVYAVAGSAGQVTTGTPLNHPAMFVSMATLGSMVLDIDGNRLDAIFLDNSGVRRDYFTIVKGTVPKAPTNLAATSGSSSQINLNWSETSTNEDGFRIERSTDNINFAEIAIVGPNVNTYPNTGLQSSTLYYFRVRAFNSFGNSTYSNTANATTLGTPPADPSSLTAQAASPTQINLVWSDQSGNESGFRIERSTDGANFTEIAVTAANATSYQSTGLTASTLYYYRVRAYNATGTSGYTNIASATTLAPPAVPAAPTNLTLSASSSTAINLTWRDNSSNETEFWIERSDNGSSFSQVAIVPSNSATYLSTGLQPNRRYYYRVRAHNSAGNSGYSNTANTKTPKRLGVRLR